MKMFTFPQKYTPEMAFSTYLSVDISCYRRTWFCAVQLNRRGTSSQLLKDVQALIWWSVLQSHSQSMCFYYFCIISDSCHINHSVMMWIYSTKGLQRDLLQDPKIKQRKLENKRSTQQLQISSLLPASFVLCFQNIKYMYTAVEHFSFLFVLHLCASLWVFLMDDFHHTADKRPTLTHLENRAFYVLLPSVTSVSLGFLPSIILQDLDLSPYCGTGSLSSWLTHLLISITSQPPPSPSARCSTQANPWLQSSLWQLS